MIFASINSITRSGKNSFTWSDSSGATQLANIAEESWCQKQDEGFIIYSSSDCSTFSTLFNGISTAWSTTSDRNLKENINKVDTKIILKTLESVPIYDYNFIGSDPNKISTGAMAQDWNKAFPSSKDPLMLSSSDVLGVALAALQEIIKQEHDLQIKVITIQNKNNLLEELLNNL